MKTIIYILFLILVFEFVACDETSTPSPSYLIEKTVESSQTEQIIESGSEFKMIFPANSLAGNLDIKVKKESSYPNFSVTNTKLGNNIYKIQFKGESTFQSPAKIVIKYDGSKIPNGKTASEVVKSYIYANGSWKLADFIIDESNKQLIISISSFLNPKINKDNPLLMESEGDIIIGEGYTTTDTGQNDDLISKTNDIIFYKFPNLKLHIITYKDGKELENRESIGNPDWRLLSTLMSKKGVWSNNTYIETFYENKEYSTVSHEINVKLSSDQKKIELMTVKYEVIKYNAWAKLTDNIKISFNCKEIPFSHIYNQKYPIFQTQKSINNSLSLIQWEEIYYDDKGLLKESRVYSTVNWDNIDDSMISIWFE